MKSDKIFNCRLDSHFENLCVSSDATILSAMEVIEAGRERLCFVVDDSKRLISVVSDGDIRRGLLGGLHLNHLVTDVHNKAPTVVYENNLNAGSKKLTQKLSIAPILDMNGRVTGVIRYDGKKPHYNIREKSIAVVGLGYVGLTLSLVFADNGFSVVGYDIDKKLVETINKKTMPFYENGLENLLLTHVGTNFQPINKADFLIADIYVITVGTPIIPGTQKPNIEHIRRAVSVVAKKLKKNDLVILRSTVPGRLYSW